MNNKQHWENVFTTKTPNEVSWTQEYPKTAIDYIEGLTETIKQALAKADENIAKKFINYAQSLQSV